MFETCKSIDDVLNTLCKARKCPVGDDYCLVGLSEHGAEFITFLDRPTGFSIPKGYDRVILYKEMEVFDEKV